MRLPSQLPLVLTFRMRGDTHAPPPPTSRLGANSLRQSLAKEQVSKLLKCFIQLCQYVEIKCQLDATDVFLLQILLLAQHVLGHHYAHHQELESIIQLVAVCGLWCLVFKLSVWCGDEDCVSGFRAASQHVEQAIRSAIKNICCI
jgi:hypothetical protein